MSTKIKNIEKTSLICGILLAFVFCLSLYIRVVIPSNSVFTSSFVRFNGYDPWYNMRLVENTLHHFPHRIYFDPFTAYPHGTYNPFGTPLFDQLLAFIIWIIGLGNPFSILGQHGIEVIGAWYPAVLGALTVFPVYFIGKELYNRGVGLLSAVLIAILPGQFLFRSLLGFTDHHAAETLFSTIAMLFFILSIKSAKEKEISFYSIIRKDWDSLRKPVIYSILAGIFLGIYYLSWVGAPLFIFILLIYAVVQYVIDHLRGVSTDYLCIVVVPLFLISLAMILPVFHFGHFVEFQVISLFLGIAVFLILSALSFSMNLKKIDPYGYPIAILVLGVISFVFLSVLNPSLYTTLTEPFLYVFAPSKSFLTIAEVQPMGWREIWNWFTTTFFVAFIAFTWIGYNVTKKWRAEEIVIIVWSAMMLLACFGQNRFGAYYAVNVAILCGFVSWNIIEVVRVRGWRKEKKERKPKKGKTKAKSKEVKAEVTAGEGYKKIKGYLRADIIFTFLVIFFVVFYPPLDKSLATAKVNKGPLYDWYESLFWMRENTPDPGVDYYALYDTPPEGESYSYPDCAYSVMNWWDNGNWITRIAHRIPVANNFRQGIGGPHQGNMPGACVFFTAKNETEANKVADALDVRYIVGDFPMANVWNPLYENKFNTMVVWAGDTEGYYVRGGKEVNYKVVPTAKYFSTMEARLHIFDGTRVALSEDAHLEPLRHYRLVHESPSTIMSMGGREVKYVKVFEYVKGARIEGRTPNASLVEIATDITTNQGREFVYAQRTISNGFYEFVVPYSTKGPIEGGTNFDVLASSYTIRAGHLENKTVVWDIEKEVGVSEKEVLEGETLTVDLLFNEEA